MIQDNEWHPAVFVELKDGSFHIFDSLKEAEMDTTHEYTGKFQEVEVNWNRGQPIVNFGYYEMAITDVNIIKSSAQ